jgi:hypothetical protein
MTLMMNGDVKLAVTSLTFDLKIGLVRESVRVDLQPTGGRLTNELLTDIAFSFLDRNVCYLLVVHVCFIDFTY